MTQQPLVAIPAWFHTLEAIKGAVLPAYETAQAKLDERNVDEERAEDTALAMASQLDYEPRVDKNGVVRPRWTYKTLKGRRECKDIWLVFLKWCGRPSNKKSYSRNGYGGQQPQYGLGDQRHWNGTQRYGARGLATDAKYARRGR